MWRLNLDPSYDIVKGSPAKFIKVERKIRHQRLEYKFSVGLTNNYAFLVSCLFKSPTPIIELDLSPLDIRITDQFNGFAFARFLVDSETEYTLRGEFKAPARLLFSPLTKSQDGAIKNLLMQMREGNELKIALLQGKDTKPREFKIPLAGFNASLDSVLGDCIDLNKVINASEDFLPDYITNLPDDYAPKDFTLKPSNPMDLVDINEPKEEEKPLTAKSNEEDPQDVQYFTPGGGVASIGPDGKPIVKDHEGSKSLDDFGEAKGPMSIDENGFPIKN